MQLYIFHYWDQDQACCVGVVAPSQDAAEEHMKANHGVLWASNVPVFSTPWREVCGVHTAFSHSLDAS